MNAETQRLILNNWITIELENLRKKKMHISEVTEVKTIQERENISFLKSNNPKLSKLNKCRAKTKETKGNEKVMRDSFHHQKKLF